MLKRQDSQLSSSSRRETPSPPPRPPHHHAKAVGCMPSIISLIFNYQKKNKRLTSGQKNEKNSVSSPKKVKASMIKQACTSTIEYNGENKLHQDQQTIDAKRLSCDVVPRSPTLPPEIRRGHRVAAQPTLMARLMGLEENPKSSSIKSTDQVLKPTVEKRKKLLEALEKCNEDLEALKDVIKAVQLTGKRVQPPRRVERVSGGEGGDETKPEVERCMKKCAEAKSEQWLSSYSKVNTNGETLQRKSTPKKNPRDVDNIDTCFFRKTTMDSCHIKREITSSPPASGSKTLIESVDEVCKDIAWGEKREIGRIGLMLQDFICRELIEETVRELGCYEMYVLPFEACRRRLCF